MPPPNDERGKEEKWEIKREREREEPSSIGIRI